MPYQPSTNECRRVCKMVGTLPTTDAMMIASDFLSDAQALIEEHQITTLISQIRRYLAAHFYIIENPREKAGKEDGFSYTLDTAPKKTGFEATDFGQQALAFDSSGKLRLLNEKAAKKPIFKAM